MDQSESLNAGILAACAAEAVVPPPQPQRTLVVTGVARSGTSMMAALLRRMGVYMGERMLAVVDEDAEVQTALTHGRLDWFAELVAARDRMHPIWGFKVPNLHSLMPLDQFALLRNPRLIVIVRDPVAVAVRHALAEQLTTNRMLTAVADSIASMMRYADAAGCPAMYLSYEKALAFPEVVIAELLAFCGLTASGDEIAELMKVVRPNDMDYRTTARTKYEGCVDGIRYGWLQGWCRIIGSMATLQVEVWAGPTHLGVFAANCFRDDLKEAGIGNGNHAFLVDIASLGLPPETVLRVRIAGRTFELQNSGKSIASYLDALTERATADAPVSALADASGRPPTDWRGRLAG